MVSAETKAINARIVLDVLAAKGGDGRFLRAIAGRESGLNHAIRHELPADQHAARVAWERNAERYRNNPFYDDFELWDHGKGLFGMVTANHLFRWDPNAHPDVLFNPYAATVAAARLVQRCLDMGAETWADVDQTWATGRPTRVASWEPRRGRMIARLADLGFPTSLVDAAPEPGGWGLGPQPDQAAVLWELYRRHDSGGELPSDPQPDVIAPASSTLAPALLGLGLAALGGFGFYAYRTAATKGTTQHVHA